MTVKNVRAFFERVEEDKILQAALKDLNQKLKKAHDESIDEVVKIARSSGFVFSSEDFMKARSEKPVTPQGAEQTKGSINCPWGMIWESSDPPPPPPCPQGHYACTPEHGGHQFD